MVLPMMHRFCSAPVETHGQTFGRLQPRHRLADREVLEIDSGLVRRASAPSQRDRPDTGRPKGSQATTGETTAATVVITAPTAALAVGDRRAAGARSRKGRGGYPNV
jgi:hypothetical protein